MGKQVIEATRGENCSIFFTYFLLIYFLVQRKIENFLLIFLQSGLAQKKVLFSSQSRKIKRIFSFYCFAAVQTVENYFEWAVSFH